MGLLVIGLSHKTAPVELREKVAVAPSDREQVREAFMDAAEASEAVVLSTCNRTEIYLFGQSDLPNEEKLCNHYEKIREVDEGSLIPSVYTKQNSAAAQHLYRVAAGLDAMVVGETQVLGQTRDAYEDAKKAGTTGPVLNKLFQNAIAAARRVHSDTEVSAGAVSVSYAAAELSKKIFDDLNQVRAMVIGAGETGRLAALHLKESGVERFIVANRSPEAARELAEEIGGETASLPDISLRLKEVDIVIGCAQTPEPLVTRDMAKQSMSKRSADPMFFIDLGMPRNFGDSLTDVYNVYSYTLDDLAGVVAQNIEHRKDEAIQAERILDEEADKFLAWQKEQAAVPVIRDLQKLAEEIRRREVEKYKNNFASQEHGDLDQLTKIIVKRILQGPIMQLKEEVRKEETGIIAGVRQLFRLGQ